MIVIGCDPGYRETALVMFDGSRIAWHTTEANENILATLECHGPEFKGAVLVIEQMQLFTSNYGVGAEIFDSVYWSGQFAHAWKPMRVERLLRAKVRGHLGASKGGDAAVRASLIHRFGPYKELAIGSKAKPGKCYGISGHEWQALAIAVTFHDLNGHLPTEIRPGVHPEF